MNLLRRICLSLLVFVLVFAAFGAARAETLILSGTVEAAGSVTIFAPFGGTVGPFDLAAGDAVQAGDTLFALETQKVYAPCDGVVGTIFAQPGDSAAYVGGRYGGLCAIEPDVRLTVTGNAAQGYDSEANRFIHIGEPVYLRSVNSPSRTGTGRVVHVDGMLYTAEIYDGTLWVNENVNVYRSETYENTSRIGKGPAARVNPVLVGGEGVVLRAAVLEGARVHRGDLLFELVGGTPDGKFPYAPDITVPVGGVAASVAVTAGQTVVRGQALAVIHRMDEVLLTGFLREVDLPRVAVGSPVTAQLDAMPGVSFEGVVEGIGGIGTPGHDGYAEYAVSIRFTPQEGVRLGMSGTAALAP
jgi:biotin carboxyl carrier protein